MNILKKTLTTILLMTPLAVMAHPGHHAMENLHGLLHAEHIIALVAPVLILLVAKHLRSKRSSTRRDIEE